MACHQTTYLCKGGINDTFSFDRIKLSLYWSVFLCSAESEWSLDAIHGFELTQSLHRVDMLLLRGPLHSVGLAIILLLSLYQRLLLWSFHPPGDGWHIEGLHAFGLLVLSRCNIGCLDRGHNCVHQVLGSLNKGHGTIQLNKREKPQKLFTLMPIIVNYRLSAVKSSESRLSFSVSSVFYGNVTCEYLYRRLKDISEFFWYINKCEISEYGKGHTNLISNLIASGLLVTLE